MAFWSSGNVTNILITWSSGKCKTLYLNFPNFYGLQTWQSSNLRWTDPILKVTWPSNYLVTWQMKKTYTSTFAIPMAIRLGRVVTYGQKTPHIKSCYLLFKWFHDKCKILYLHFRDFYDHQTWQSSNLRWTDPSFKAMWPFDHVITWQTKKIISEFPQYILAPNLAECKLMVRRPYKLSYMTFWSHCHVTDIKPYNYTSAVLTTTKLGRVVTFGGGLNLQSHMNFWLRGHVRNEKDLYLHLPNTYDHQTWQSGNLYWGNPTWPRGKWETLYSTYLRVVLILLLSDLHAFLVNVYLGCKCLFVICFYILNIFLKTFIYSSD